jgi:hypothetical protein
MPGLKKGANGGDGFFVRGGSADQNLIRLDGATVYNPNHLLGFFSVFNSDAIQDLKLYKVSSSWLLKNIQYCLGIYVYNKYLTILDQFIWHLGNAKLKDHCISVIVARNLANDAMYFALERYLYAQKSTKQILVISLAHLPPYFRLPAPHVVLTVYDLMIHDQSHALAFDIELILVS